MLDLVAVWKFRYFWMSLVKMDLMTRYRRSMLGIVWSLLHPLGMTAIFCLVFSKLVGGGWEGQSKMMLCGMAVFNFIRDCTVNGCNSLIRHEGYIRQAPLPFAIYSLRTVLSAAVHFLITVIVLVVMVAVLPPSRMGPDGEPLKIEDPRITQMKQAAGQPAPGEPPAPIPQLTLSEYLGSGDYGVLARVWKVLPVIPLTLLFCWALATITGFATVYFHDISHLLELAAQFLFFATPVIWLRKNLDTNGVGWMVDINPAAAFIDLYREPLVYARNPSMVSCVYAVVATAALVLLASVLVKRLSQRVIFQM